MFSKDWPVDLRLDVTPANVGGYRTVFVRKETDDERAERLGERAPADMSALKSTDGQR